MCHVYAAIIIITSCDAGVLDPVVAGQIPKVRHGSFRVRADKELAAGPVPDVRAFRVHSFPK